MPPCERCCKASPTRCCGTRPTSSGNSWTSILTPSRCSTVDVFRNEPAMSVPSFSLPPFPLNRRDMLIGGAGAAAGLLLPRRAGAQTKLQITEGNVAPLPIAIPDFVAGSPGDGEFSVGGAQGITNNLKRSGLFARIDQAVLLEKIAKL